MSQYPSPYSPPQFPDYAIDPNSFRNPLAPARRASILMFILGALSLLCGAAMMLVGAVVTPEMIASAPNADQLRMVESQTGIPLRAMFVLYGALFLLPGFVYIVLGFFVRRGGLISCVLGAILTGITILLLLLLLTSVFIQKIDVMSMAGGTCMFFFPAMGCVLLMMWLIQAIRAAPAVAAMRNQFNAQYWQSYQQQQQYAQGGYGYGPGAGAYQAAPGAPAPMPQQMYQPPYPTSVPQAPPPPSQIPAPNSPQAPTENQPQNPTESQNRDSGNRT